MADEVTDLTRGVYRRLYSGYIKGQRINKLSLQAEAWFWRVFAVADDFGNHDADPELVRAATKGRRSVTVRQVERWLGEMESVGLVSFYYNKGERYMHILRFEETQPAGKNGKRVKRFPLPGESNGIQVNPDSSSASHSHSDHHTDTDHKRPSLVEQARRVFGFWREHLNHPRSVLDTKREKAITARLKDGYSVDDLMLAVRGCKKTPHNMGKNDRDQVYDDIELICRDAAHVDRFILNANTNGQRAAPKTETLHDKLKRESCEDCHGTGTKVIRGKGAQACDHANAVIARSSESVEGSQEDRGARVS